MYFHQNKKEEVLGRKHTHKHKHTRARVHYAKIYQRMKLEVSFLDSLTIKGRAFATSMRLEKLL